MLPFPPGLLLGYLNQIQASLAAFAITDQRARYFDLYAPKVFAHGVPGITPGLKGLQAHYAMTWEAFPDGAVRPEAILECGKLVTVRFTFTGKQTGDFRGFPASGRPVEVAGISILRFEDWPTGKGLCAERWTVMDSMSLAAQIGMIGSA